MGWVSRLYRSELTLPVAPLGDENPLPLLRVPREMHELSNLDDLPEDLAEGIRYGGLHSLLPCLVQDGYGRERTPTPVPAVVLENERVRATVLPSYGGRLWSLESDGRELLYRNPVVQPANLALRNAWLAGGVEWNLGSTGHWTNTCEPLHAATVVGPDGEQVLRLWEWERTRNLVVQLDFWLPTDSAQLYVGVRIRNPHDYDVPAYWWSNIAVPQSPGGRVITPADQAWHFGYQGSLDLVDVPEYDGIDLTYPMQHKRAADFFFELPPGQPRWICAVDESGTGMFQASTARLRGRKLFVWGTSRGGRRWQDWLAPGADGHGYTEIQAGLARTQLEHLRLPAATSWSWLEAYGPVAVDGAHEPWPEARRSAGSVIEPLTADLDSRHDQWLTIAGAEPSERLLSGSGWGALEVQRLKIDTPGTPFDQVGPRQQPWKDLLEGKPLDANPAFPPDGTLVAPGWRQALEAAPETWLVWYHRGVARWYDGEHEAAREAWDQSRNSTESAWALRNLAVTSDDPAETADLYRKALRLAKDVRPLAIEALEFLLDNELYDQAADVIAELPPMTHGRIRLAEVRLRLARNDAAGAQILLDDGIDLADLREGANRLAELWREVQVALGTDKPVPDRYDFSMVD
jgi:Domain of unknown function (DUF5107)